MTHQSLKLFYFYGLHLFPNFLMSHDVSEDGFLLEDWFTDNLRSVVLY